MGESDRVSVDGGSIHVEVEGEGHPLLLIHGGLGDHRMWDLQVPAFAERYRVIRYDTRGFGRTETDDVAYTDAADAIAVLDHVGATSAYLIGQSRGGSIALDVVVEHPERVDAFVSVAGGVSGFEAEVVDGPPADEMERLYEAHDMDALAELETRVWVDGWGQPPTRVDPDVRRLVHGWIEADLKADKPWGKPGTIDPPAAQRLGQVDVPVLVMIGEVDEAGSVARGRYLAASVPGARLESFPNVAHMIQLEEPDRFAAMVLAFLADPDRARTG